MNPSTDRWRPVHRAVANVVAFLQQGAFWIAIALAVLYVPLLGVWADAVPLEMIVGLVGFHGVALLVGHGHQRSSDTIRIPANERSTSSDSDSEA